MKSLLITLCPLLFALSASAAERVAIVIGNSVYDPQQPLPKPTDPKDPGNPNLPNPVNDAAGRNSVFTENFAKQIQTGKDIYVALRDVSVEVKKAVTRQTPWLESFGDAAALADIRFAPASYVAPPPVPTGMTEEEVQRRVAEALAKMVPKVDPRSGGVPPPSVTTPSAGPGTAAGSMPLLGSSILDQGSIGKVIQITLPSGQVMKFAYCPPGSFTMGSPASEAERGSDEDQVEVTLTKGFWMAQTECTQAQWQAVMGTSIQEQAKHLYGAGADLPMYQVSHDEASVFCEKVQGSVTLPEGWKVALPSEAQWEYACRAGTSGAYAGTLDRLAWYSDNSDSTSHAVAGKQANAWGLYDMHGNVFEWCADWYDTKLPGGTDPRGATTGALRVFRGGSWFYVAAYCRAALRDGSEPGHRSINLGFRPALVPSR